MPQWNIQALVWLDVGIPLLFSVSASGVAETATIRYFIKHESTKKSLHSKAVSAGKSRFVLLVQSILVPLCLTAFYSIRTLAVATSLILDQF